MTDSHGASDGPILPSPPRPRAAPAVRTILVRLVLAALLPGAIASAVVLYMSYRSERVRLERDTVRTARALMQAVDGDIMKAQAAAQALSTSGYLATGNLTAFHAQATKLLQQSAIGNNIVLSDATGQQVLNAARPYPGPLPRHGSPEQVQLVFQTAKPAVSDVYIGGVLRRPVMSVDVPVPKDGSIAYALSIGLFPERFGELLRAPGLPPEWVVAVFDSKGVVAARTHAPEKFVGGKAVPAVVKRIAEGGEGIVETKTLEGISVIVVLARSHTSNWTVGIGIPVDEFEAPLRRHIAVLAAFVVLLSALGIGAAWALAARITRSIHALTAPALALGAGRTVAVPEVEVHEAAEVADALATAGRLLDERTRELEAANRELQEFSYSISHDLSTPLRAIAAYAQLTAEEHGKQLDDEGRRLLDGVRGNVARMGRLIDGLTDFMQISRRPLSPDKVDLAELARGVFAKLHEPDSDRRLELRIGELPPAWGDRAMLRRVLECLIGNAAKFIPAQAAGVIELSGETAAGECVYHVADNGVGFDQRYAGKLFKVFERVHAPGQFEGVGIGLAIVRRILGRHGGRAWAEGRVGHGATFHFALPLRQPD